MMRVQWKLFLILCVVGVVPMVLVAWVGLNTTDQVGRGVTQEMERGMTAMVTDQVERDAAAASAAVSKGTGAAKAALRALVLETEKHLAGTITMLPRVYYSDDYDAPDRRPADVSNPPGYVLSGTQDGDASMAVSFNNLVFVTAPDVSRLVVREDTARLARLLPTCRSLFQDLDGSAYRLFVSLENGLTAAYPGFGGYPKQFDPRRASWYLRARDTGGGPVWSELLISRSTGMALFSFTSPVRDPGGTFAGVASVELPLTWFLQEAELASVWTERMHSFLVGSAQDPETGRARLRVLARQNDDQQSELVVGDDYEVLENGETAAMQAVADDILAGGTGVTRLVFEGEDSILAYAPLGPKGMAFLLAVPVSVAQEGTQTLRAMVEDRISVQWLMIYVATVILALVAAGSAYLVSRRGARVTTAMTAAWKRLAGGDFEVRLDLRTGDERDALVQAFNDTVPKLAERLHLKRSVSLAREVQQRLLPEELPETPGLDVAGTTLYCDETGGDYYDVMRVSRDGALLVAVADVSGHDVASALLMASTRALLRGAAHTRMSLAERVASVNRLLTADVVGSGRFVTLFCLEYDPGRRDITWVRAGHESGWFFGPDSDQAEELGGKGAALGFAATSVCEEGRRPFDRIGCLAVVCTDGVFESVNKAGEPFGRERFLDAVREARSGDAGAVVRGVIRALAAFQGEVPLADDVTVVAIRRTDAGPGVTGAS